ncbi:MAG TPA: PadR family transcriptional regulator [Vicinamibacteria bacterium]|nr:PadR family transcriptional regulator [Vicinamibacteria bacterium]
MPRSLGPAQIQVLEAVASGVGYGFDVMESTTLPSGTVYPALSRLERAGLVRSRWESAGIAHREKRPQRRYYEVTPAGREVLAEALTRYRTLARCLARTVKEST